LKLVWLCQKFIYIHQLSTLKKITTTIVCWALPPTRDMDYHIREILGTYFKLSSFTFEQYIFTTILLGVFTLWTLLTSFILGFRWQRRWCLFLPLSSSGPITTTNVVTTVVCGNNKGGKQVVTKVWICRWKNLFRLSLFHVCFWRFFMFLVETQNSYVHAWVSYMRCLTYGKSGAHALLRKFVDAHFLCYWIVAIAPSWIIK
jgi:hypothetical protein